MEEGRSSFKILTDTTTGKRPLGSPRRRWEDNIRMNLKEIGINTRDWVDSKLTEVHLATVLYGRALTPKSLL